MFGPAILAAVIALDLGLYRILVAGNLPAYRRYGGVISREASDPAAMRRALLDEVVLVDSEELDLSLGQAEVAIRFARQTQPSLIQRPLMSIRYHVFASKDYLTAHGTPQTPADLDGHALIVYGDDVPAPVAEINWLLDAGAGTGTPPWPRHPARAGTAGQNVYGIYRAIRSGVGIGALPYYMSNEAPDLVEILPGLKGPSFDAYFVYPEEPRHSKCIAVVRDFLLHEIAQDTGRDDAPRA